MSETIISSSSKSTEKAIDEYYTTTNFSGSSNNTSHSGSGGSTTNEGYTSGVPGVPLEVLQEQLRKASRSQAGTSSSVPPSSPLDKVEPVYSCAVGVPSKTNEQRLNNLRTWYQIPDELNPRLLVCGEWCCNPHFGIGVYKAYFLGGLRLSLNAFIRELLVRLGLGVCQFNPNAWRLIIFMQILWREVFGGDRPLTVDEFLFCYKPLKINQSHELYSSRAHPQANGQVEVANQSLLKIIKTRLERAKGLWLDDLPTVLWAYRTTIRTPTGETPFKLAYGSEAVIPAIHMSNHRVMKYQDENNKEQLCLNLDLINEVRMDAEQRTSRYKNLMARRYDAMVKPRRFNIGDLILKNVSLAT